MTAPTLAIPGNARPVQRFISRAGLGFQPIKYKKDNGNLVIEREPVFRSGTFRDSMGEQMQWEPIHMDQMVTNYNYLVASGSFANVPARDGHAGFLISGIEGNGRVVGWHTGIDVESMTSPSDGEEYSYILASYELTEPDAIEKLQRGTWRNRSAEIYRWVTNAEAEFWPVYGGFAFVDIPAVEGLNFSREPNGAPSDGVRYFVMKETTVTSPASGVPTQQTQPAQASALPVLPTPGTQQHAAPAPAQHMFTINGVATSDYAAVQRHIAALEGAQTEARNTARSGFVTSLAQRGLIVGSDENLTALTAFAQGLNDEQFEQWSASYAAAPQPALFGQHGAAQSTGPATLTGQPAAGQYSDEIETARDIVKHLRASMPEDEVKRTPSFAKLVAAGIEK